jgi:hypothetical protein
MKRFAFVFPFAAVQNPIKSSGNIRFSSSIPAAEPPYQTQDILLKHKQKNAKHEPYTLTKYANPEAYT